VNASGCAEALRARNRRSFRVNSMDAPHAREGASRRERGWT